LRQQQGLECEGGLGAEPLLVPDQESAADFRQFETPRHAVEKLDAMPTFQRLDGGRRSWGRKVNRFRASCEVLSLRDGDEDP
jgi:hypothetical protein